MIAGTAMEAHSSSTALGHNEKPVPQYSEPIEDMSSSHRYSIRENRRMPATLARRSGRRKRRGIRKDALQELDDAIASVGSRRGENDTWNDGDSLSICSQSIPEDNPYNQRSLIANLRDIKSMRGKSASTPSSARSHECSSKASRRSHLSSGLRRRQALEQMISITLLETAKSTDADNHFLSSNQGRHSSSMVSTDDILTDLVTVSKIVDQETLSQSPSSASNSIPRYHHPKNLLPAATSGDDSVDISSFHDNVHVSSQHPAKPIFFKLQKQAHQTIPDDYSPRNQMPSGRNVSQSPEERSAALPRQPSPGPFQPVPRRAMDSPVMEPKKHLRVEPSFTEDGFPVYSVDRPFEESPVALSMFPSRTDGNRPVGKSTTPFFRSQKDVSGSLTDEWNTEWTAFDTSPFGGSTAITASPNTVRIQITASVDSGNGSKYSI